MSFKKTKVPSAGTKFLSVREAYEKIRVRNALSAFVLWGVAVFVVLFFGSAVFAKVASFRFDLPLPSLSFFPNASEESADLGSGGKFNLLLTGVGGGVHDGGNLTDTVILASVNRKENTVSMLSLPRDLYVEYPFKGRGKLNELYPRALKQSAESVPLAMKSLSEKMTEITGERVDRYVNVDFEGFARFVDVLGGIEIDVPEDLVDTEYPDDNWGYETFKVSKGRQQFDGKTALKYARSRHSTSDFDRSLRQQSLIRAIKEKLLSLGTLGNPVKLKALYSAVSDHIHTDMPVSEIMGLAFFAKSLPSEHILSFNLNDTCFQSVSDCDRGGFLYTPARDAFGGAAVLLPEGAGPSDISEYRQVQRYANLVFNYPRLFLEKTEVNVINATKESGAANRAALFLKKFGFNVPEKDSIGSTKDPFEKTAIFHVWDAESKSGVAPDSAALEALSLFVFADPVVSSGSKYSKIPGPKIEIVLGPDYRLFFR